MQVRRQLLFQFCISVSILFCVAAVKAQEPGVYEKALSLYQSGQYGQSLEFLRSNFNTESYEHRLLAAMNYYRLKDSSSALAHIGIIEKKWPGKYEVAILHAAVYAQLQNIPQAERVLVASIRFNPENVELRHELARLYYDTNRFAAARQQIARILSLKSSHAGAIYLDGLMYARENDFDNAEFRFKNVLQLGHLSREMTADLYNNLGFCFEQKSLRATSGAEKDSMRKQALEQYDNALRANPAHQSAAANKARLKSN